MATVPARHHSASYVLGHAGLCIVGLMLTLFGVVLCATLWLLPVGLPLALVGVALMEAAGEAH